MVRQVIDSLLAVAGVLLLAATFWGSGDNPEPPSAEQKQLAAEAAVVATFRPADFLADPLAKAVLQEVPEAMEREFGVTAADVERMTFAALPGGDVTIVRMRKAYDPDKVRARLDRFRGGFLDKEKGGGPGGQPALNEKKIGGRTIQFYGQWNRWTEGWCALDKTTYMRGRVGALERLLASKGKPSEEMSEALSLNHSLVVAVNPRNLRTMMRFERQGFEREMREMRKKDFDFKEDFKDKFKDDEPVRAVRQQAEPNPKDKKAGEDELDDFFADFGRDGMFFLPYKPLLESQFALMTLDIRKTYTLTGRVSVSKENADDAETAAKSLLYVAGQLAVMLPKDRFSSELHGLKALSEPLQKAFKAAKVERKDNTLRASVTFTPGEGLAKRVQEDIAAARNNRDRRFEKKEFGFKDKVIDIKEKD